MPKSKRMVSMPSSEPNPDKPRLINILAELCQCDPAAIEWDGEGPADTIAFNTGSNRYLLKLAREPVQGSSAAAMDFRVRVLIS